MGHDLKFRSKHPILESVKIRNIALGIKYVKDPRIFSLSRLNQIIDKKPLPLRFRKKLRNDLPVVISYIDQRTHQAAVIIVS